MYLIGLTGNIATGKSLVAEYLMERGAGAIDADRIAHQTMSPGEPAWEQILHRFGNELQRADGTIDRPALARIVFDDLQALRDLESIVHPQVLARIDRLLADSAAAVFVVEAIKLLESGLADRCQALWVTTCRTDLQLERLTRDRGLSAEDARRRMRGQPDPAAKVARADVLLVNEGTRQALAQAVDEEWGAIAAGAAPDSKLVPAVCAGAGRVLEATEGTHTASARPLAAGDWQLASHSPTRMPRLLRGLIAALESKEPPRHLHVPRETGYLQFMRGMGYEEVSDCVTESGDAVFRR